MSSENAELLASFVTESNEALADIENDLLSIEEAGANIDSELVNKVFRGIHSMKGASGFLGLTAIGSLSHELENVLNLIRGMTLVPTQRVVDALLKGADALRDMVNNVETSNDVDVSEWVSALKAAVQAETSPETQEILEQEVDVLLPNGNLVFPFIHTQDLISRQQQGYHIYVMDVDFIADVHDRGKTPLQFLKEFYETGELIHSYLNTNSMQSLQDNIPETMSFMMLVGSKLSAEELTERLQIPSAQIWHIASPDQTDWGSPQPADSQIPVQTETPAPVSTPEPSAAPPPEPVAAAPAPAPEPPAAPPPAPEPPAAASGSPPSRSSTPHIQAETNLRVNVKVLDTLMNLAGELVLGRNQLLQVVNNKNLQGIDSVAARIDQVTSELQDAIMQTRMQPIGAVFNKFPRIVRDLSGKLGKRCELAVEGKDVELDKAIIEGIGDPLTHLIRNSVDHGVEAPEIRASKNKHPEGKIVLRAFHEAGKVNITISDDGAGIDGKKLRDKAVSKGLITADAARDMSDRDAVRLIFHPGFSMAEKVSDVSGRGVGMDVVKTNIEKLGGTVEIDTQVGVGTTIKIKLPLTLAIIPSLVVGCGEGRFAIPQVSISELVRLKASEVGNKIERVKNAEVLRLRGNLLPLIRLSTVLDLQPKYWDTQAPKGAELKDDRRENIADRRKLDIEIEQGDTRSCESRRKDTIAGALNIIVVETGLLQYGLIVDALYDSEEIVVKPLGQHMKTCDFLAGATILGDGTVALIVDVAGVANQAQLDTPDEDTSSSSKHEMSDAYSETQKVLLFTNHPREQFAIPMTLISRIERIRSEQIDSVGGQEVLQYRGSSLSLLSLEHHVKAQPRNPEEAKLFVVVFNISNREIGLVAPRLMDIRDVPVEIDTSTFVEPGILGSTIVENAATRLVDIFALTEASHPDWFADREVVETSEEGAAPTILLAEDSGFFRNQLSACLQGEGYNTVACEDGQVAWETLQDPEQKFDIVVTDIEMPNMDGLELSRHIKGDPVFAHLPIIAITSLAGEEDIQRGIEAGINDYQIKLDKDKLLAAIARHLRSSKEKAGGSSKRKATAGQRR